MHQNLAFPVQPDPWSGMHCWLQKVTLEKAHAEDQYGDVVVDTAQVARGVRRVARLAPGPPWAPGASAARSS